MRIKLIVVIALCAASMALSAVAGGLLMYKLGYQEARRLRASTAADVSELISRLRPFTRQRGSSGYLSDIRILFDERGAVRINLRVPHGGEYEASGASLSEGIEQLAALTAPSLELNKSLRSMVDVKK